MSAITTDIQSLVTDGGVSVVVRVSNRARRMSLRVDPRSGGIILTLPTNADVASAKAFVSKQTAWIEKHASALPERIPFAPGVVLPLRGIPHHIRHEHGRGPPVSCVQGELVVTGDRRHVPRRVGDFLRAQAKAELSSAVCELARRINRPVSRITVRDPKTRWGSCSSNGTLSFSWRLVLAPRSVLTYVAAHEVAHLRHANHGPRFWALVGELHPGFQQDRQELKRLAFDLNRYSESPF